MILSLEIKMLQDTLLHCLEIVVKDCIENDVVLSRSIFEDWDHINYGSKDERHYEIVSLKGKKTNKYLHVYIYRFETGRYELNFYIL